MPFVLRLTVPVSPLSFVSCSSLYRVLISPLLFFSCLYRVLSPRVLVSPLLFVSCLYRVLSPLLYIVFLFLLSVCLLFVSCSFSSSCIVCLFLLSCLSLVCLLFVSSSFASSLYRVPVSPLVYILFCFRARLVHGRAPDHRACLIRGYLLIPPCHCITSRT
jgi:hypothetical protein